MILVTKTSGVCVCVCVCVCVYYIAHNNRAIRPCRPSHSISLAVVLPRGGSMIQTTKTLCVYLCVCVCIGVIQVTDEMIMAASEALASCNSPEELAQGRIYPGLSDVRGMSAK